MMIKASRTLAVSLLLTTSFLFAQTPSGAKPKPRVVVIGVNGMEMDVLRPLHSPGQDAKPCQRDQARRIRQTAHCVCAQLPAGLQHSFHQHHTGRAWRHRFYCGRSHGQHEHAERGADLVDSFQESSYRRHGECTGDFPGDAGEWVHGQRYAHPRKKLRGRRAVCSQAIRSGRRRALYIQRRSSRS